MVHAGLKVGPLLFLLTVSQPFCEDMVGQPMNYRPYIIGDHLARGQMIDKYMATLWTTYTRNSEYGVERDGG